MCCKIIKRKEKASDQKESEKGNIVKEGHWVSFLKEKAQNAPRIIKKRHERKLLLLPEYFLFALAISTTVFIAISI